MKFLKKIWTSWRTWGANQCWFTRVCRASKTLASFAKHCLLASWRFTRWRDCNWCLSYDLHSYSWSLQFTLRESELRSLGQAHVVLCQVVHQVEVCIVVEWTMRANLCDRPWWIIVDRDGWMTHRSEAIFDSSYTYLHSTQCCVAIPPHCRSMHSSALSGMYMYTNTTQGSLKFRRAGCLTANLPEHTTMKRYEAICCSTESPDVLPSIHNKLSMLVPCSCGAPSAGLKNKAGNKPAPRHDS